MKLIYPPYLFFTSQGMVNQNVLPAPSFDSTPISPFR